MNTSNSTKRPARLIASYGCLLVMTLLAVVLSTTCANAVTVTGGKGASLSSIAGSPTLVTVVLRGGAKDPNLQVVKEEGTLIIFSTEDGDRISYQKTDIAQIEVQGSVVEKRAVHVSNTVVLRPEDQRIVDGAIARMGELFQSSKDNQGLRIWAAGNMAFGGNKEATEYLTSLANSNNLQTRLDAARGLYLGEKPLPEGLVMDGLDSSNRNLKAQAAVLAGLFHTEEATPELMGMLNDRSAQFSAPAAIALARLKNREIVPTLFEMLGSTSDEKNNAGVMGLITLGGADIIDSAKYNIEKTDGLERYRLIYVLHCLGAPEGRKRLIQVFNEELTIRPEAALVLAADDYWEAIQYLQGRLKRREDPTEDNLLYRARTAHAILQSGDPSAVYVFQSLLRRDNNYIRATVLNLIADLANRNLLKLIQPAIRNVDPILSLAACNTAVAIANPDFRDHLKALLDAS